MQILYNIVAIAFFLFSSFVCKAQYTLQQCQQMSVQNNVSMEVSMAQQQLKNAQVLTAKQAFLPSLSASVGQSTYAGRSINPFTNQFEIRNIYATSGNLSFSWTILNGEIYQLQKNRIDALIAKGETEIKQIEIKHKVTQTYFQAILSQEQLRIAEKSLENSLTQKKRIDELFQAGHKSSLEQRQIENTHQNDKMNVEIARERKRFAFFNLCLEMGIPFGDSISLAVPEEKDFQLPESPQSRTIANQKLRITMQGYDLLLAKRRLLPTLSFSAGINSNYSSAAPKMLFRPGNEFVVAEKEVGYLASNPSEKVVTTTTSQMGTFVENGFLQQIDYNRSLFASVSLSIPIYNKGNNRNQIKISQINAQINQSTLKTLEQAQSRELEQAKNDLQVSRFTQEAKKQQFINQQEIFLLTKESFLAGKTNFAEFNQAKFLLEQAENSFLVSQVEYLMKLALIEIIFEK